MFLQAAMYFFPPTSSPRALLVSHLSHFFLGKVQLWFIWSYFLLLDFLQNTVYWINWGKKYIVTAGYRFLVTTILLCCCSMSDDFINRSIDCISYKCFRQHLKLRNKSLPITTQLIMVGPFEWVIWSLIYFFEGSAVYSKAT